MRRLEPLATAKAADSAKTLIRRDGIAPMAVAQHELALLDIEDGDLCIAAHGKLTVLIRFVITRIHKNEA